MIVEQNVKIKKSLRRRTGPIILLVCWIFACLNINTAYKSKLSAIVTNPPYKEPADIVDLVENGYKFVVNNRYRDVFVSLLLNTSDPVVQYAQSITESKSDLCEEFVYAVDNRAAILDEYASLQYELRNNCKRVLAAKQSDIQDDNGIKLRITKKPLRVIGQVWLFQKRAPYKTGFNIVLDQIIEAGLLQMWKDSYTKKMVRDSFPTSRGIQIKTEHKPLRLRLLLSHFTLYLMGNSCGLIAFALEIIVRKIKTFASLNKDEL